MYITKNKLFTIILVLFFGTSVFSQFKINEYSCANVSGQVDAFGTTPDWFEIYNPTTSARSISGYYVSNDINQKGMWQFPINTTIPSKGFLVVFASGFDTVIAGEYHTNFDLLQTKGQQIILSNNSGAIVDSITIRRHQHNHSWGRVPDGGGTWKIFPRNAAGAPTASYGTSNSPVGGLKSFKDYLPTPTFDLAGGFYSGPTQLSLSRPSTTVLDLIDPQIYFTGATFFDGADPSINGTLKRQFFDPTAGTPIYIDSTTVIRAYLDTNSLGGTANGYLPSFMVTNTYFINNSNVFISTGQPINTDFSLPTVSITYDTSSVGAFPGGPPAIAHNYMISMEYYDKNGNFKFETVGTSPGTSPDDALPFSLGGIDYYADDEYGYSYTNKQQFYTDANLKTSSRTEQRNITFRAAADDKFPFESTATSFPTHMRDAMAQTYAMKNNLDIDGSRYQPCIMYLNGKYWGVYEIREVFDEEYVKYYYGMTPDKVQVLQNDGVLQGFPPLQAAFDWGNMVSFITTQNMANDSLLHMADSMLSFSSLIDLVIYNSYTVNGEFPNKAMWWRATDTAVGAIKWRYHMFDMDDIYGLNKNNSGLASTLPDASSCQYQTQFGAITDSSMAHLAVFNSLMVSDTFKSQFINRYSYLLNTSLKCTNVINYITSVRNILKPEMAQHTAKWGGTEPLWDSLGVDTMKYWINQRCGTLTEDIKSCFNVTGPLRFCTEIYPLAAGSITLNSVNYPEDHSDSYFGNVYFNAIAVPADNFYFDHWEPTDFTLPDSVLRSDSILWHFDSASCLKAVFKLKEPYNLVGEPIVPTGFSPNGDGNNDLLNVYGTRDVTDFVIEVYNRWGQRIFQSTDKTKGWDGNFNGAEAPVGVYAYTFKVTAKDGTIIQKSGSITLIR